jgi:hypothetical protein
MSLSVLGAGLGRTGTLSLKLALERLGFGPCHHMMEVFPYPDRAAAWVAAAKTESPDWDALFDGFRATVDWPGVTFWRELSAYYPEAKMILSLRDPDRWFDSTQATIFNPERIAEMRANQLPDSPDLGALVFPMFDGRIHEREHCIEVFKRHSREVIETVPPERLLQFRVADGWEPLCSFLGCDVPDEPFPKVNESAGFHAMIQRHSGKQ